MVAVLGDGTAVVRTYQTDADGNPVTTGLQYDLIPASPGHDMWSLGCVLYQMSTGETLLNANDEGNIDQKQLLALYEWSDELKQEKLAKVQEPNARNLLSRLLSNDPTRPPSAEKVLAHPFLSGKTAARMVGEEPKYDYFLSYRVTSDAAHAQALYDKLTGKGFSVYLDSKCLVSGQDWEEGFVDGVMNSRIFIPILSKDAINNDARTWQNFSKLTEDSVCDNVYLEHRLALELKDMGLIEAIYPVMVGKLSVNTEDYRT